jgi:hypothetical protein
VVLPSLATRSQSAPSSETSLFGWNPRWFLTNIASSGSVIAAALLLTHVMVDSALFINVATLRGEGSTSCVFATNGTMWPISPPMLAIIDTKIPSASFIQIHGDALPHEHRRGDGDGRASGASFADASSTMAAPFGVALLDRVAFSDLGDAAPQCLWTSQRSTSSNNLCPTYSSPGSNQLTTPVLQISNISAYLTVAPGVVTSIAPDSVPALLLINNITATIQWSFHNVLVARQGDDRYARNLFAQLQFPASMPGTRVPITPLFVWSNTAWVSMQCVAFRSMSTLAASRPPTAADVLPSTTVSAWNLSQLNYLVQVMAPSAGSVCLSFTQQVTVSASLTPPNETNVDPSAASMFSLQAWADVSSSAFPIIMLVLLCIIPRHLPAAVLMLTIVALGNVESRALSILDNPLHINLGDGQGNSAAVSGTLQGSLVSLAIVWIVWSLISIAASSMSGGSCSSYDDDGRGDDDDLEEEDGNEERSARLVTHQRNNTATRSLNADGEEGNRERGDTVSSCSVEKLHPVEMLAAMTTPTTVMLFPWFMVCSYSLMSGSSGDLTAGVVGLIVGLLGGGVLVWKSLTVRQVSLPYWLVTKHKSAQVQPDIHTAGGQATPVSSRRDSIGNDASNDGVGCWERLFQSPFELIPSGSSSSLVTEHNALPSSSSSSHPESFHSTLWLRLLMKHLHVNWHVRYFAVQIVLVFFHATLIACAAVSSNAATARGLFGTSAALSAMSAVVFIAHRPLGAIVDTLSCFLLSIIGLTAAAMCASDPSSHAPAIMMTIAGGVAVIDITLTTVAGCLCSNASSTDGEDAERRDGMYTCFLADSAPEHIAQSDWDTLKRLLYAKLLDDAGDDERSARDLEGVDALTVIVDMICKMPVRSARGAARPDQSAPYAPPTMVHDTTDDDRSHDAPEEIDDDFDEAPPSDDDA